MYIYIYIYIYIYTYIHAEGGVLLERTVVFFSARSFRRLEGTAIQYLLLYQQIHTHIYNVKANFTLEQGAKAEGGVQV